MIRNTNMIKKIFNFCIGLTILFLMRNEANPFPGPFEISDSGLLKPKVWPISQPK
jgi:hypothetical protein